jgi:hypothetical protein
MCAKRREPQKKKKKMRMAKMAKKLPPSVGASQTAASLTAQIRSGVAPTLAAPLHKLPSNVIVDLTPDEIVEVDRVAQARPRFASSNHPSAQTRRDLTRSQLQTDRIGLMGAYAVAKLFGLGANTRARCARAGALLKGLKLPNGSTVQVKAKDVHTNPDRPYWFALDSVNPREFTADVGILAYVYRREPKNDWHIVIDGQQHGPFECKELLRRYAIGEIDEESFVWRDGMEEWATFGTIAEFRGRVKIPGCITRDRFIAEHVLANLGTGPRAAVATCRFDPIENFDPIAKLLA